MMNKGIHLKYLVKPGTKAKLKKWPPNDKGKKTDKAEAKMELQGLVQEIAELQEKLYAQARKSLLIILQAMDTGGKDSTIKHVMSSVNPQGCQVTSFKRPNDLERSHHYLWRINQKVPPKGFIGIFNRSHYEDVLVPRVHGEISVQEAGQRLEEINDFERALCRNGTKILKFFLHISKEEQRRRLLARIQDPKKHWKFSPDDLRERKLWGKYQRSYEEALSASSTRAAPWFVIPADHKWYRDLLISKILVETLRGMKLRFPRAVPGVDFRKIKIR